jgi:N-acetylglucosaminyl-diphospho-decaprenol L-rhamnosyltransferase
VRPAVSAVIVNYRSAEHTVACVASLRACGVEDVVVVDNASGDDCRERLAVADPACVFLAMERNRGYGAAANAGVVVAGAPVVLVCNPDLIFEPRAVAALGWAFDADVALGAVGPRIDRPDGTRYPSARSFPSIIDAAGHGFVGLVTTSNRFSRRYLRPDALDAGPVDWVSGACLAVRRSAFDAVGGFDEAFFMFMEDVDLCWRLGRAGWRVAYEPRARVTHIEGVSRQSAPYRMIVAHHLSLMRYGARTTTGWGRLWLPPVALGLIVRTAALCLRRAVQPLLARHRGPGAGWEAGG